MMLTRSQNLLTETLETKLSFLIFSPRIIKSSTCQIEETRNQAGNVISLANKNILDVTTNRPFFRGECGEENSSTPFKLKY